MGKHDNEKSKKNFCDFGDSIQDLKEAQKAITKKIEKAKIPCSHTNENGKLKVRFLDEGSTRVQCKRCGEIFDFKAYSMDTVNQSVRVLRDVINQIKALSDDPVKEKKLIRICGELIYNLETIPEAYEGIIKNFNKGGKKKKKNRDYESFGQFGSGSVRYLK